MVLNNFRQIILALCGHRLASSGNSSAFQVYMYSGKKGCTEKHISPNLTKCRCQTCARVRERCAVMGDKWVVLATCGIKDHPLISQHTTPLADAITYLPLKFCKRRTNLLVGASRAVLGAWSRYCSGQHTHVSCVNSACILTRNKTCKQTPEKVLRTMA